MEPLDPAKNDDSGGLSKHRRISSILKAPRKSIRYPEPEQQENVVECAKPVEKRNSRRVSFAPANDVLLFTKDVKNASPARSPLQELMTTTAAAATQNRVQVAVTEDGVQQQIMGMETLLNAPLHTSQQRDKVNFDTGDDYGEKTVMFSDDAFMDMTHSHTINIANDGELLADISLHNYDVLPTRREKTVMFTADDGYKNKTLSHTATSGSMDLSAEIRNVSSSVPSMDPGFENFLASLSKPSAPSINPVMTRLTPPAGASSDDAKGSLTQIKTQKADVDKENQVPTSVSAAKEKSLNTSRKISESSLYPKDDVKADMSEAQTDRIRGLTDDNDPFQWLFPTQETHSHLDNRVSQTAEKTKPQQSSKTLASFNTKEVASLKNPSLQTSHQRHKVDFDTKDECREKTIIFTASDEFMDMTQSHTVNIASGSFAPPNQSNTRKKMDNASSLEERKRETCGTPGIPANGLDLGFKNFLASLSKTVPTAAVSSKEPVENRSLNTTRSSRESFNGGAENVSMDMTEAQTGRIVGLTGSDDPFQFLFPTQALNPHRDSLKSAEMTSGQKNSETLASSDSAGMETSLKPSLKTNVERHQVKFDAEDDCRDKTVRFSADDACMDVTRSLTVNIASNLVSDFVLPVKKQEVETSGLPRNRSSSAHRLDPGFITSFSKPSVNPVIARMKPTAAQSSNVGDSSNGSMICPEDDVSMDMTEAQTGHILGITSTDLQSLFPTKDMYPQSGRVKKAEMTSRQQHSGSSKCNGIESSLTASLKSNGQQVNFDADDDCRDKTVRFTADDACMDVTKSHTVNIASVVNPRSCQNVDFLPACGEKTVRFSANDAAMDMTQSHTVNIATDFDQQSHQNVDFLPAFGEKTVRFTANDAAMDVTRSHTVNIATVVEPQLCQNVDFLPACGEKTVRFTANDAGMDMTQSHTVNIATDFDQQSRQNVDFLPAYGEKTVRFTANDAAMDVTRSHTVNIATVVEPQSRQNVDFLPAYGEKTVRFTANDAAMDMTQSHTVNIATDFDQQSRQNVDFLPACGEKTVRFTANDAAMDMTQSHTVNIATDFNQQSRQNVDFLPACGEKTVRFTANDAAMDMTQSHTVNIATDFNQQLCQNVDFLPACGEKTVRFTANDAAMDVTLSHTVDIATVVEPQSRQNVELLPTSGEKTVRFTANDAGMDVTRSHTVNIATDSVLSRQDSNISSSHENMDFLLSVKKSESETCRRRRNRSLSVHSLDPGFKNSLSKTSGPSAYPVTTKALAHATPSPQETMNTNGFLDQLKMQKLVVDAEKEEAPGFGSAVTENPVNKTMIDDDVCMDMTEAQTGNILAQTCTDEYSQDLQIYSDHLKNTEVTSQQSNEALGSSNPDGVAITNCPDSLTSNETDDRKDPDPRSQPCSGSAVDHDVDAVPSRKSRRISLADVHSKVRRLSQMIKSAPESVALDNCTATLPQLEHMDMDKNPKDKTELELELGLGNTEENTQAQCLVEEEQTTMTTTTPFNLKTKQLMSRLSVGGFKAKLPQRSKPDDPKKVNSVGEHTRTITVNVTNQLNNFDDDVSDIYDEELGSLEDMSEMLDTRSPQKATEEEHPSQEFNVDESLEDDVFDQDFISAGHGKKRPLPVDEDNMEDEKRMKASMEMAADFDMGLQSQVVEYDGNITTAPGMTTQTTDYSNSSHTASIRCEATFNSTFKQSMFESQLEDYANDVQRKLDDGTITVLEFLKLFNIDFVIHNPRQSVLPGRLLSDTDRTPMDFLKDRHINRPKQMVYETNVLNLTEKVEGLKVRMRDLDKPLNIVNRPLWEEMRNSSEKELKSFGAKLKERNNLFRKTSKVQSHEMKEVLYSDLVHANLEEQQKLRGTIEKADEMIRSLDDCIGELEAELAGVEEKGFDDKPSLKSCQEEMQKVTAALADNDRQISELEMQKKQNSNKLNRLKAETRNLESHITALHMVNEWKFGAKRDNCTVYTFLHDTFHLQLVYEKSDGNDADHQSERKISHITFKHQLDDEESQGHACLVHKLLSQFTKGEASWVEKYPMSRHVPKLLHDVGLVVSRCRLLGEELRLLKMWGSLKLDILNISCVDTRVHIVFSSLKKFSKFEVIFSVSLTNHLCALQVQSFKNMIGNTTIQQIEEIVASFVPGKKLLTKIVKKIHENLLC